MVDSTFEKNPRGGASYLSIIFLWWMKDVLKLGNERPLTDKDLFPNLDDCKAEVLIENAEKIWFDEVKQGSLKGRKPRLWKALIGIIPFRACLMMGVLKLFWSVTFALLPVCLWLVLKTLNDGLDMNYTPAILYVAFLGINGIVKTFSTQHYDYMTELWGLRLKVATIGLVYRRILSLSRQSLEAILSGNTINLVSNDAQKIEKSLNRLSMVLLAPLELASSLFILWFLIGWQALVGAGLFLVLVTFQITMAGKAANLRHKAAGITDRRLVVMNEIISGIRALKMYAWEWNFRDIVRDLRRKEMKMFHSKGIIVSMFIVLYFTTLSVAMLISVTALIFSGTTLTSFMVFTLLTGMIVLKFTFCTTLSQCLMNVAETKVALDRIQCLLMHEGSKRAEIEDTLTQNQLQPCEVQFKEKSTNARGNQLTDEWHFSTTNLSQESNKPTVSSNGQDMPLKARALKDGVLLTAWRTKTGEIHCSDPPIKDVHLSIVNVSCSWTDDSSEDTIHATSLDISKGNMVAITGPVGSGKSSLLMAVLGELSLSNGNITCHGKIAFVPQIPWVFSGTVRDNILFGLPYVEDKFQHVIQTCGLRKDLDDFTNGDQTEIGQRGVSLSGGQKARVGLARAVYSEADIYLLDDPLSAVDAKVGKTLFESCILGTLSGRIRLLVTHQLQYLKDVDHIVVMDNGSIAHQGGYAELKETEAFSRIMELFTREEESAAPSESYPVEQITRKPRKLSNISLALSHLSGAFDLEPDQSSSLDLKEEEEEKTSGTLTWRLYWDYFREALSTPLILLLVFLLLFTQVCLVAPNWWLAKMADMSRDQQQAAMNQVIHACLVAVSLVVTTVVLFFFYFTVLKASENLHNKMSMAIIRAPVLFFDKNPAGRILNRFSKDLGCMDDVLPPEFQNALQLCLFSLSAILVPAVTNYWIFLALLPIIALFVYFARYYLKCSRELKRIEAIRCSPVFSHITETVAGLEVVHSSHMQRAFLDRMNKYQDENTQAFFMVVSCARWLGLRLDLLCIMFVITVTIGAILIAENPALAGLALTYAIQTLDQTQYGLRLASEVENLMTSVERVMTYTSLDPEPGYSAEPLPPETWPEEGTLELQDLSLVYMEGGPRVLKDINLVVSGKEKVGVVGRTGAGKSSLVSALFRMPEPSGKVLIDGVVIGALNLQAARRSMAVITQDPVIFGGSLRRNLDPFFKYRDQGLWTALEEVQMKNMVENLPGQLDYQLKEGGTNFSVGERQLVCLARALLQRSKIIIMDEATANVDFKTDRLIQEVIRSKFQDSTVVTIAHRLNTIIDYDKVLVLDGGRVVEFDKPNVLLNKKDGLFAELVRSHGHTE